MSLFDVRDTAFSSDEVIAAVSHPAAGGVAVFLGVVRNENDGQSVVRLEYEAYATMAVKEMTKIGKQIAEEIPGARVAAIHRVGSLEVGDTAIVCAASAPHRSEAFEACRALIDRIKADVPVWKREHGPDGPYWVGWQDARCVSHDHPDAHDHD